MVDLNELWPSGKKAPGSGATAAPSSGAVVAQAATSEPLRAN